MSNVSDLKADPSRFKAILFDMDGVILDSEPIHQKALKVAMDKYGIVIPTTASDLFRGLTEEEVCTIVVDRWANGQVSVDTLVSAKHAAYADLAHEVRLMPGIYELIEYVDEKAWPLGLVTSAAKHDQVRAFRQFSLGKFFQAVVTVADITHPKPHPQPYQYAASQMKMRPQDCLVIEDSKYGVASARAAGCAVFGLSTGIRDSELLQAGAHRAFNDAHSIKLLLSRMTGSI